MPGLMLSWDSHTAAGPAEAEHAVFVLRFNAYRTVPMGSSLMRLLSHVMKTKIAALFLSGIAPIIAADALPPDLRSAQARYESEMQGAIRPILQRYIAQLESAKKSATARNDLKTANAIEAEIQRASATAISGTPKTVLCAYLWTNHGDTWEFSPGGKLFQRGTGWEGESWVLSDDEKSLELKFSNGQKHVYAFRDGVLIHFDPKWGAFQKRLKK